MFERILERMRRLVRDSEYVLTVHGHEAMEDDDLTIFDVERCLLPVGSSGDSKIDGPANGSTWSRARRRRAKRWWLSPRSAGPVGS